MIDGCEQMFQPRYTMNGFELNEQRGIDGIGYVRALRSILTANLPVLQPALRKKIESGFTEELAKHKMVNGKILRVGNFGRIFSAS